MNADEMFEKLGYKKDRWKDYCCYTKYDYDIDIGFNLKNKTFYGFSNYEPKNINLQELQAINKKVEELGWLE